MNKIRIPMKALVGSAYLYMLIPIIIFLIGWLKPLLAVVFSVLLIIGFINLMINNYIRDDFLELPTKSVVLTLILILFWIAISGIGGFWFQKWDWHWRNAIFRDLIDYSWPVIYPETGNALIYYFIYFLVPALIGKIAGWTVANVVLYIWTCLGIFLVVCLLCKQLNCKTNTKILIVMLILIFWEGLDIVGWAFADILGYGSMGLGDGWDWAINLTGYQYSPNNTLIAWVTNQTIVPWIAMCLFLNNRNIKTYAYLGLCVLPFAPLPFVGLFIIFVVDAIEQLIEKSKHNESMLWLKQAFSVPNICAMLSIFIVFLFFYSANTATNGNTGVGGIGLYIRIEDFKILYLITLIVFWILHFLCYSMIVYKENRKSILFWTINISLFLIPLFRVGSSRDFCMRASIPALFILMIYVLEFVLNQLDKKVTLKYTVTVVFLGFGMLSVMMDWGTGFKALRTSGYESRWADGVSSFCNLDVNHNINFLAADTEKIKFFNMLAKNKTEYDLIKDKNASREYFDKNGITLSNGNYFLRPYLELNKMLWCENNEIKALDENNKVYVYFENGRYIIQFESLGLALDCSNSLEKGELQALPCNGSSSQQWEIIKLEDCYNILFSEKYALTYNNGNILLEPINNDSSQLWRIDKKIQ